LHQGNATQETTNAYIRMNFSVFRRYLPVIILVLLAFAWFQYRKPSVTAGDMAPDFEASAPDGRKIQLSDLRGQYVLLQFWGSWCGPCRKENPELVALYNNYKAQSFTIFSVGIEQNLQAWERAIEVDGLVWPHHFATNERFDHPAAKLYNVKSIPSTFLINPEGRIMGVNLSPAQMERMLGQVITEN
jgi:peroxiredoxin